MTVSEFVKAIGVSGDLYLIFMDHDGPNSGRNISVYENAWRFFKKRQLNGIQMPPLKRAKRGLEDLVWAAIPEIHCKTSQDTRQKNSFKGRSREV